MLGILNFSAAPKVSAAATPALDGTKHGPEEALGSFGALLAQIATGEGDEVAGADGRLTQLAAMLGQFRSEAQESLAEVFPDGVIVPGAEFNNWAKAMLIRLDTMLQGAGASAADLARVLDPMEGLLAGDDAGRLLTQAAQTLMGQTPGMATGQAGQGAATADTLHLPEGVDLPDAAQVRAMFPQSPLRDRLARSNVLRWDVSFRRSHRYSTMNCRTTCEARAGVRIVLESGDVEVGVDLFPWTPPKPR